MRRQRWIAVMVSLALFLTGTLQLGQTKGRAAETRLTVKRDEIGKCSIYGHRSVKKEVLNTKDLGLGRSKMSRNRAAEIPRAYDARKEGLLTEIKDQGALEICWAFAVIGASEANVLQEGWEQDTDLSEYHLAYSAFNRAVDPLGLTAEDKVYVKKMSNDIYSWGGNAYLALSALARWQGEVAEETAPIEQLKKSIEEGKTAALSDELMFEKDRYHLQNAEFIYLTEGNRDLIKQKLMQKGAAAISLHMPENEQEQKLYCNTGNDEFTAYYCDNPSLWVNHEVLVVGWDDDYAVSNFNSQCRPSKPGAWLLRNSWGDYNELGGYFWLSYEDTMLQIENNDEAEVIFYGVEPADNYDHNYQYDTGDPINYINGLQSIANVYTAQDYELLQAVSFYTQERDTRYSISVYRNAASDDPSSGIKMGETLTGTISERGYHTIKFSEVGGSDIPLAKGDRFSIVLRLTDLSGEGENAYYTYESYVGMPQMRDIVTAEPGESFWSEEGDTWNDFSDLAYDDEIEGANFCLKAFTKVVDESVISTPTPTIVPTQAPTPTPTIVQTPTPTPTIVPTQASTPTPTMVSTQAPTPTLSPTQEPTYLPTMKPLPSSVPDLKPDSIQTLPTLPVQTQTPGTVKDPDVQSKNGNEKKSVIVKKLAFTPGTKTVKAGKKLKLAKYLKITKRQKGTPKIVYEFTKKKYKKFASLSQKGVLKARKAGRKHTLYVRARARDGSGKTAKIKIKIK